MQNTSEISNSTPMLLTCNRSTTIWQTIGQSNWNIIGRQPWLHSTTTCILMWPIRLDRQYGALILFFCDGLCGRFFFFCYNGVHGFGDLGPAAETMFVHRSRICAVRLYLPTRYRIVECGFQWNTKAFAKRNVLHSCEGPNNNRTRKKRSWGLAYPMRKSRMDGPHSSTMGSKTTTTFAYNQGFSTSGHKLLLQVQNSQETKMHLERETEKDKFGKARSWAPWLWGRWFELRGHCQGWVWARKARS